VVFSDQFARIIETVWRRRQTDIACRARRLRPVSCALTRVSGHNHPGWLRAYSAKLGSFFHGLCSFNKLVSVPWNPKIRVLREKNFSAALLVPRKSRGKRSQKPLKGVEEGESLFSARVAISENRLGDKKKFGLTVDSKAPSVS